MATLYFWQIVSATKGLMWLDGETQYYLQEIEKCTDIYMTCTYIYTSWKQQFVHDDVSRVCSKETGDCSYDHWYRPTFVSPARSSQRIRRHLSWGDGVAQLVERRNQDSMISVSRVRTPSGAQEQNVIFVECCRHVMPESWVSSSQCHYDHLVFQGELAVVVLTVEVRVLSKPYSLLLLYHNDR